jgi:uncharacterized protein (DUF1015 family)|tara:strand:+ start:414 stop:1634 length:1221 start_codon:yes stop_codon:yes gene_type:complete
MAIKISAFTGLRPIKKLAHSIVSSSFDNLSSKEIKKASKNINWNFLNILSPETFFPSHSKKQLTNYVRGYLKSMVDNQILFKDDDPNFYIYKLSKNSKVQFGVIASIEINKQSQKHILPHEKTFIAKENSILRNLESTKTQVGPVYLTYKNKNHLKLLFKKYSTTKPEYFFTSVGGTKHSLWVTKNSKDRNYISSQLLKIETLYIADGHHRFAAISKLFKKTNQKNNKIKSIPLLAALFDQSSVKILSYNRLIKLKKNNSKEILDLIKKSFVAVKQCKFKKPNVKGDVMLYICNKWFSFNLLNSNFRKNLSHETDIDLINSLIVNKICRIKKNEYKNHINYLPGKYSFNDLEKKVRKNEADMAFFVCPMSMHEIISISNRKATVPQKSTFFDPKLIDGLVNLQMKI